MRAFRLLFSRFLAFLRALPPVEAWGLESPTLDVTLLIPVQKGAHLLEYTVTRAHRFLSERFGSSFEVIIVPNGARGDRTEEIAKSLAARLSEVRQVRLPPGQPHGKGAALRHGFLSSRGRRILFTDADLPYDLSFFDAALEQMSQGADLVTGNRRLPQSVFQVPVGLLSIAHRRHRTGVAFNRAVRSVLGLSTTDTQAGIKAMSRRLALAAFSRLSCPGFFFDLEIFLTARAHAMHAVELPVTLALRTEKSTIQVFRDALAGVLWLARIAWRDRRGCYGPRAEECSTARRPTALSTEGSG